jgi:hypothetical protein
MTEGKETSVGERRASALRRANNVRRRRAEVKQELRAGKVTIFELLADSPDFLMTARLGEILGACPGYGRVRVERLLRRCHVSSLKTVGELTARQRELLLDGLGRD